MVLPYYLGVTRIIYIISQQYTLLFLLRITLLVEKTETKWMLTLQKVYPFGLNDRISDEYMTEKECRVVSKKFFPLHRLHNRPPYNANKTKLDNSFLKNNFIKILQTHLDVNIKDAGYFIRVSIKSFKKSTLKTHFI